MSEVQELLAFPFLSESRKALTIYDVEYGDFSFNEAYKKLYMEMLDYSRANYWWIGDKTTGDNRIPKLKLNADGETQLQHKYSIVYENWCFAKLVAALCDMGLKFIDGRMLTDKSGSCAHFKKADVDVKITHGIVAHKQGKTPLKDEFIYVGSSTSSEVTPDFAIVIKKGEATLWIVADAKSDSFITEKMIKKRTQYCDICRHGRKPFVSILIRSGEADGNPEIEIPSPDASQSSDYSWHDGYGIVEGDQNPPFHGHLRINVESFKRDPYLFQRFIKGMIENVSRMQETSQQQ